MGTPDRSAQSGRHRPRDLPRSDNYYGWAKIAYEGLGWMYACGAFGRKLEVVQLRIGAPREIDAAQFEGRVAEYKRDLGAYLQLQRPPAVGRALDRMRTSRR